MAWKRFPWHWCFVGENPRSPVKSPHKGRVMHSFDVYFDDGRNKLLNKQSYWWWVVIWRSCDVKIMVWYKWDVDALVNCVILLCYICSARWYFLHHSKDSGERGFSISDNTPEPSSIADETIVKSQKVANQRDSFQNIHIALKLGNAAKMPFSSSRLKKLLIPPRLYEI